MCELVRGGPCAIRHIGPDAPTPNSALLSRALNKVNDFNACTIPQFSALNSALNSVHRIRTKHCTALSVSFCIFGTNFLVCPVRPSNPWDRSENPKKWPSDPIAPAPGPGPLLDLDRGSLDRSGSWTWIAPGPGPGPLLDLDLDLDRGSLDRGSLDRGSLDRGSLDRSGSWRSWRRSSWTAPAPGVAPGLLDLDHPGTIPGPSCRLSVGSLDHAPGADRPGSRSWWPWWPWWPWRSWIAAPGSRPTDSSTVLELSNYRSSIRCRISSPET